MTQRTVPVVVQIQDKEFRIACPEGEQEGLMASARYLDARMREIRSSGKVVGADRIAMMAAINIAHELLQCKEKEKEYNKNSGTAVKSLHDKLQAAVNSLKQMDL